MSAPAPIRLRCAAWIGQALSQTHRDSVQIRVACKECIVEVARQRRIQPAALVQLGGSHGHTHDKAAVAETDPSDRSLTAEVDENRYCCSYALFFHALQRPCWAVSGLDIQSSASLPYVPDDRDYATRRWLMDWRRCASPSLQEIRILYGSVQEYIRQQSKSAEARSGTSYSSQTALSSGPGQA